MKSIPAGYENDLLTMVEILRITYYLYEFKRNRRGTAPIYCKLTTDGAERQQFSTGLYVTPDLWDKDALTPQSNASAKASAILTAP